MNIFLTTRCDQNCSYCFVHDRAHGVDMTMEEVDYLCSMADFPQMERISLLGGEPTLHPCFVDIVSRIRERNANPITIFSHMGCDPGLYRNLDPGGTILVANIRSSLESKALHVRNNIQLAHDRGWDVVLSYTIYEETPCTDWVMNICTSLGIHAVRWSLAMPSYSGENQHQHRRLSAEMVRGLTLFIDTLLKNHIAVFNDCPVPLCGDLNSISDALIRKHNLPSNYLPIKTGRCSPTYDIMPGYCLKGCMGVGERIKMDVRNFRYISDMEMNYSRRLSEMMEYRFKDMACVQCSNAGECDGGCWGYDTASYVG